MHKTRGRNVFHLPRQELQLLWNAHAVNQFELDGVLLHRTTGKRAPAELAVRGTQTNVQVMCAAKC